MQQIFRQLLWIGPLILQAVIAIAMLVRGLYKQLPYFFTYTTFVVLNSGAQLFYKRNSIYLHAFWLGELLSWILGIAVIYEIYASLLKEYALLQKLGTWIFRVMCAVLMVAALWTALSAPSSDDVLFNQRVLTLERSVRIVQCGLLVALFLFASFFGLSWKSHLFGIAIGFATFVCIELAVVAMRSYLGSSHNRFFVWLRPGSYALGIVVWALYVVCRPWRATDVPALPRTQLAEWNDTLQELLHR